MLLRRMFPTLGSRLSELLFRLSPADKIFIITQCNGFHRKSREVDLLFAVILFQYLAVNVNVALQINLHRFPGKADDSLYIVSILFILKGENDDIKTFRF